MLPKDLKYKEYVWVKVDGDVATLGVTDYALEAVKEIVFIDLPKQGQNINKGDVAFSLESVKWSGHISAPVSGVVVKVNDSLFDEPAALNKDAYGSWICRIKLSDTGELKDLMDAETTEEWVKENLG